MLDHLNEQMLAEIDRLEIRLEAVARHVDGSVKQLQEDRAAAKKDMNAIADKLVAAAEAQRGTARAVALSTDGQASVAAAVDYVLDQRTAGLVQALSEAKPSALGELKGEIQTLARVQAALLQQQEQSGVDWTRLWPFIAACVASAVISGAVVAYFVKPAAPAVRQDLTLGSGQKIDAGKQEQR